MPDTRRHRPWALLWLLTVVGAGATLAVSVLPFLRFAYEAPALHVVLETTNSLIALLVGLLVYGRFRRSARVDEMLLVCSLAVVAVANLVLTAIPTALELAGRDAVTGWAPLVVRLAATLLLIAAALTPRHLTIQARGAAPAVLFLALFVTLLAVLALLVGESLPPPVDPAQVPASSSGPAVRGHPAALAVQGFSCLLYAVAAVAFTRRAASTGDELLRWVGAACVLTAFARVNYLLFPSLYSDYVYAGDLLRLGYYLLLLVGAVREISGYWQAQAQAAVLEDRRRMARDLHDGLTQELSYIWAQSRLLAARPGDVAVVERINGASARALDEARTAIAALTRTTTGSFAEVLRESVEGLAGRYGARARVEVPEQVAVSSEQGDALLRIVAEAFRNAVRHGGATTVAVTVTSSPLSLEVRDDGTGFDAAAPSAGFGLTSMRERAEALGAEFRLRSAAGSGTVVEVRWP